MPQREEPQAGDGSLHPEKRRRFRRRDGITALGVALALIGTGVWARLASKDASEVGVAAGAFGPDAAGAGFPGDVPDPGANGTSSSSSPSSSSTTATLAATAPTVPAEPALLYARRRGSRVTVYRQAVAGGAPKVLFAYDDASVERPEEPAFPVSLDLELSPDRRSVAFVARSGLQVRDLRSGRERSVIARRQQVTAEGTRVFWSIPEMNPTPPDPYQQSGVFSIGDPRWSADGRHLAFSRSGYEFQGHGIVALESGRYFADRGSEHLVWSPAETRAAVTGTWYAYEGELHVSAPGDLGKWEDIRSRIGGPRERSYEAAVFDPAGRQLAVTFADEPYGTPRHLGVVKLDGSGFRELDGDGAKTGMAFTPDGSALVFAEPRGKTSVLVRHDLRTGRAADLFTLPGTYDTWVDLEFTSAGDLALVGRTRLPGEYEQDPCGEVCPEPRAQFFLFSLSRSAFVWEGPVLDRFGAFAGLLADPAAAGPARPAATTTTTTPAHHHDDAPMPEQLRPAGLPRGGRVRRQLRLQRRL